MRKISLKTALCAVFFSLTALVLNVCILEPITVNEYVENETVQGIIERGAGKVIIVTNENCEKEEYWSDSGLTAGNGRISGLNPDKYYIIEEWVDEGDEEDPYQENVQFVRSDGTRTSSSRLFNIGKVSGGTITGLTNGRWYIVKSAKPLPGTVTYYDLTVAPIPGNTGTQTIGENGEITTTETSHYLGLPPAININSTSGYSVVKIPVSPVGRTSVPSVNNSNIIELEGKETVTDYIFYKEEAIGEIKHYKFYVLKVTVEPDAPVTPPGEITLTVTLSPTGDNSPVLDSTSISYQQNSTTPITINITNSMQFSSIKWYLDGNEIPSQTGSSLTIDLNNDAVQYRLLGEYTITVEAVKDGIPYSATIKVTVTE